MRKVLMSALALLLVFCCACSNGGYSVFVPTDPPSNELHKNTPAPDSDPAATDPTDKAAFDQGEPDENGLALTTVYCFPNGLSSRSSSGYIIKLLLPAGWRVEKGIAEDNGYYPDNDLRASSPVGSFGDYNRSFTIYGKDGIMTGHIVIGKTIAKGKGSSAPREGIVGVEYSLEGLCGTETGFLAESADARKFASEEGGFVILSSIVVRGMGVAKGSSGINEVVFPAIAAYDAEAGAAALIEFNVNALTDAELEAAAQSAVIASMN